MREIAPGRETVCSCQPSLSCGLCHQTISEYSDILLYATDDATFQGAQKSSARMCSEGYS